MSLVSYRKKDPVLYLNRCKELLREDGLMILVEVTAQYEIALSIQGLLGTEMENLGEDRAFGTYYRHEQLLDIFKECDFRLCSFQVGYCFNDYDTHSFAPLTFEFLLNNWSHDGSCI